MSAVVDLTLDTDTTDAVHVNSDTVEDEIAIVVKKEPQFASTFATPPCSPRLGELSQTSAANPVPPPPMDLVSGVCRATNIC